MRIFAVQKLQERYLKVLIINTVISVQQSHNAYGGAVKIIVIIFRHLFGYLWQPAPPYEIPC